MATLGPTLQGGDVTRSRQLVSAHEATRSSRQHTRPCSDCPWSPKSIPGWLGRLTAEEWIAAAHGETHVDCHTLIGPQCAGVAIYRANVCKLPRDPEQLRLPADRTRVFPNAAAFRDHHRRLLVLQDDPTRTGIR